MACRARVVLAVGTLLLTSLPAQAVVPYRITDLGALPETRFQRSLRHQRCRPGGGREWGSCLPVERWRRHAEPRRSARGKRFQPCLRHQQFRPGGGLERCRRRDPGFPMDRRRRHAEPGRSAGDRFELSLRHQQRRPSGGREFWRGTSASRWTAAGGVKELVGGDLQLGLRHQRHRPDGRVHRVYGL